MEYNKIAISYSFIALAIIICQLVLYWTYYCKYLKVNLGKCRKRFKVIQMCLLLIPVLTLIPIMKDLLY